MGSQSDTLRMEFRVKLKPMRKPPRPRPSRSGRPMPSLRYALVLGHQLNRALENGEFRSHADIGHHVGLTEMRVSQLLGLTLLAPFIQQAILTSPESGLRRIPERRVRSITRLALWEDQQSVWEELLADIGISSLPEN